MEESILRKFSEEVLHESQIFNDDCIKEAFKEKYPEKDLLTDADVHFIQMYLVFVCGWCHNTVLLHEDIETCGDYQFCSYHCFCEYAEERMDEQAWHNMNTLIDY